MADIKPMDVKKLRDATAAGMKDCKNALVEANGDFKEAQKILRKKGLAAAGKRTGRATNEGNIFIVNSGKKAVILEMTCETAFVSKNDLFKKQGQEIAQMAFDKSINSADNELVQNSLKETISIIKENMLIKKLQLIESEDNSILVEYRHSDASIGTIVKISSDDTTALKKDEVKQFASDCAMHVAAFAPAFLDKNSVDQGYKDEQIEVFTTQAKNLGKPEKIVQGIVQGKLNKHLAGICLLEQDFVKDDKNSVEKITKQLSKEVGAEISVTNFIYMKVGQ